MSTKMSINISDDARALLEEAKTERGIDYTTTVHRGFSVLKFMFDVEKDGDELLVRRKDGSLELVKFLW